MVSVRKPFGLPLPSPLADIAEVAGLDAAMALSLERGGARFNIPITDGDTELARIVGAEAARKIVERFGGQRPYIPLAKTHLIKWLHAQGHTQERIALKIRCSRTTVQRVLDASSKPQELPLFRAS